MDTGIRRHDAWVSAERRSFGRLVQRGTITATFAERAIGVPITVRDDHSGAIVG
jgi:hypothetical protein